MRAINIIQKRFYLIFHLYNFKLFSCLQRSLTKSVGEHLAMKSVKGEGKFSIEVQKSEGFQA